MNNIKYLCNIIAIVAGAIVVNLPAAAEKFSFAALGDTPYHLPGDFERFARLIERINVARPAFSIHVGDIKPGNTVCSDEYFAKIHEMFANFNQPLIYTPGDNEWTDCHRIDNGGMDPIERLAKVRALFFADPAQSHGREKLALQTQAADKRYATYIENRRWERGGVHFATLHIVGSNNNLQRDQAAVNEYIARNAANLAWMQSTFAQAKERNAKAVVLAFQADPGWEHDGFDDRRAGFNDTLNALRRHARDFDKPVLIVHGDRHRFVIDKPLRQNRQLIPNVTRLMVFGDNEVHGVLITVDTDNPDIFSFSTLMVPENLPAAKP
jgi:pimeloyl-ACP methyl ester carboxylesterase